jgi:putative transposase
LTAVIVEIHQRSRRTYGAPRVHGELVHLEQRCSRKRVARLMAASGLVGVHARRRWRNGRPDVAPAADLVNRDFTPRGPDQVWAADVTQFRTTEGWLHLAAVIDLWSRRVVGWSMSTSPNSELVTDALMMAFERRRPDRRVVHHSDRGAAYTSFAFSRRVAELELDQSFGSTGDCYDNAAVESFWATLKRELAWIHHTTTWTTRADLRSALFDYIEGFYNPTRIQRRLGHHSPVDYEQQSVA